jgi:hypothetical protein
LQETLLPHLLRITQVHYLIMSSVIALFHLHTHRLRLLEARPAVALERRRCDDG